MCIRDSLYNEWKKNAVPKKSSAVVQFRGQDLLCRIDDNGLKFPSCAQFTEPDEAFTYLFELDGREYYCLLYTSRAFALALEQPVCRKIGENIVDAVVKDILAHASELHEAVIAP